MKACPLFRWGLEILGDYGIQKDWRSIRPTIGGAIGRKFDPETGTGFWEFKD